MKNELAKPQNHLIMRPGHWVTEPRTLGGRDRGKTPEQTRTVWGEDRGSRARVRSTLTVGKSDANTMPVGQHLLIVIHMEGGDWVRGDTREKGHEPLRVVTHSHFVCQ